MSETAIKPRNEVIENIVPYQPTAIGGLHGQWTADDVQVPALRIIQAVGQSAKDHPKDHGAILYGADTLVPRPVTLSVYGLDKRFVQNLPFEANSTDRPKICRDVDEVLA